MSEKFLKENLKTTVHITEREKNYLYQQLFEKKEAEIDSKLSLFNILNIINMSMQKFKWVFAGITVFILGVVSTAFVFKLNGTDLKLSLFNNNNEEVQYTAMLSVQNGEAYISRGDSKNTVNDMAGLLFNDEVVVSSDGLSVINAEWGSVALGGGSEVKVLNNSEIYIKKGKILANTGDNYVSFVNNQTVAKVRGTVLAEIVDSTTAKKNAVYAANESVLIIIVVDGDVTITKDENEVVIKSGKKIVIKDEVENPVDLKKEDVNDDFVKESAELVKTESPVITDYEAPIITIKSPADGITVKKSSVEVVFTSNEDGWYLVNDTWKELKANEVITLTKKLKEGSNSVVVTVKDNAYNKTSKKITVKYVIPVTLTWTTKPVGRADGVYMAWKSSGLKDGDYIKIFRNGSLYKAYKVNEANKFSAWYLDPATTKGVTYKYHIAIRRNDKYVAQTNDVSVVAQTYVAPTPTTSTCTVSLWRVGATSNVVSSEETYNVKWSVSGDCGEYKGYKLVWNTSGNPVYPGDSYHYYGSTSIHTGTVPSGTWYVRVGLYRPDHTVKYYSNQLYGTF